MDVISAHHLSKPELRFHKRSGSTGALNAMPTSSQTIR
jgi:hypothetical protein